MSDSPIRSSLNGLSVGADKRRCSRTILRLIIVHMSDRSYIIYGMFGDVLADRSASADYNFFLSFIDEKGKEKSVRGKRERNGQSC